MRPRRASVAGVLLVVSGVLPGFLTASLAARIDEDFGLSESELGVAVACFYAVCALGSPPCGRLVERIGPLAAVRLGAASTVVCALAVAAFAQSPSGLLVLLLLGGFGNAAAAPAASRLMHRHLEGRREGLAFGVMQSGAPIGALLAGLSLPAIAIPFGWRWAFGSTAVIALVAAAVAPATARESGARDHRTPRPRRGLGAVHAIGLAAALASAAATGMLSFLVLYGVQSGMSETAAGLLLAGVSLGAATSRVILGALTDRRAADPLRPVATMLAISAGGYLLLLGGAPLPVVAGALIAGSVGWAWSGSLTHAAVRRSPEAPAWGVGVMMAGLFGGAMGGPLTVGLLADAGHFTAAWLACAALATMAAATVAATRRSAAG